uniref:Uncharacterized protein n=1 Tax=Triticum urartu TaxID=4572 RepID=A0A8R7PXJ0_TRIUA
MADAGDRSTLHHRSASAPPFPLRARAPRCTPPGRARARRSTKATAGRSGAAPAAGRWPTEVFEASCTTVQ